MIISGVDLGVRKVAISLWQDGELINVVDSEMPQVLRTQELRTLSHWAWRHLRVCDSVWIEEPLIGRNPRVSLKIAQTCGAVLSQLADLERVDLVPVSSWKKEVTEKGNASKEEVASWLQQHYASYAAMCAGNQDRIDATCIGLYGVRVHERAGKMDEF